jgi:hypothetical protein
MKNKTYAEKLKDPRWQRKRLEIMARDDFSCRFCGEKGNPLHVHHAKYSEYPWETANDDLFTLCEDCHSLIEGGIKKEISDLNSMRVIRTKSQTHNDWFVFISFDSKALIYMEGGQGSCTLWLDDEILNGLQEVINYQKNKSK